MNTPEEKQHAPEQVTELDDGEGMFTFADGDEPVFDPHHGFGDEADPTTGGKLGG